MWWLNWPFHKTHQSDFYRYKPKQSENIQDKYGGFNPTYYPQVQKSCYVELTFLFFPRELCPWA